MGRCPTWWPLSRIRGALCESPAIPFLVQRRKAWLMPAAGVPCSNAANIGERKTWTQSAFYTWQILSGDKSFRKCIYIVPAQETAKHHTEFDWPPVSDIAVVTKPRRETRWNLLECPKLPNRSQPLVSQCSPYCGNIWRRYGCLIIFPIVNMCLRCEDIARQPCAIVRRLLFLRNLCVLYFSEPRAAHFRHAF